MRLLLVIALLLTAATAKADCPGGVCKLKSAAKAVVVAPAKVVKAVVAAPAKCCRQSSGVLKTASFNVRPGFFGHHRMVVAKRHARGGFIARLRFKPG